MTTSSPSREQEKSADSQPVRIAAVRYLNTLPLIEGLEKVDSVRVVPTVPSRIADMVLCNEADIGLASIVDIASRKSAQSPDGLTLLPVGCIGCDGPTLTVRLLSTVPLDRITELHADTDSHTSVILARLILKKVYGCEPVIRDFDVRERIELNLANKRPIPADLESSWPAALLMIGDKVVTDSPPAGRYPFELDLGEAWKKWTGLAFTYAAWACRTGEESTDHIRVAAALLARQRLHNATRGTWLANVRGERHRWPEELASKYLLELLRFDFDERQRAGAERFVAEAHQAGLLGEGRLRIA
ncbi:MAG: MqnA/MqnD/SBP family protein [Phycisphaerales bacterium]